MDNLTTLLGQEPRASGLVPGTYPLLPRQLIDDPLARHYQIILGEQKMYRFPLIVRMDHIRSSNPGRRTGYRWMLYALSCRLGVEEIETALRSLVDLKDEYGEHHFPLLIVDIQTQPWAWPLLGKINVSTAPAFVPAALRDLRTAA